MKRGRPEQTHNELLARFDVLERAVTQPVVQSASRVVHLINIASSEIRDVISLTIVTGGLGAFGGLIEYFADVPALVPGLVIGAGVGGFGVAANRLVDLARGVHINVTFKHVTLSPDVEELYALLADAQLTTRQADSPQSPRPVMETWTQSPGYTQLRIDDRCPVDTETLNKIATAVIRGGRAFSRPQIAEGAAKLCSQPQFNKLSAWMREQVPPLARVEGGLTGDGATWLHRFRQEDT